MKKQVILLLVMFIFVQIAVSESDFDMDGIADSQDKFPYDYDNDGMPDSWEKSNGLRFDVNDAKFDYDTDGLNNLIEYNSKTDPFSADSDGDKISDKDELEANTNPLDPKSPSKFDFNNLIIVLLAIFALIGIIAIIYSIIKIKKRERTPLIGIRKPVARPMIMPLPRRRTSYIDKIIAERQIRSIKERRALLSSFEEKKALPEKQVAEKAINIKPKAAKKSGFTKLVKRDVFSKLSELANAGSSRKKK